MILFRIQAFSLIVMFCLFFNTVVAETLFVKSSVLAIKEMPRFSAPIIVKIKRNTEIEKISTKGFWLEVNYLEKTGWIPRSAVSKHLVSRKIALRSQSYSPNKRSNRRHRIKTVTAVIGVRGLLSSAERKMKLKEKNFERLAIVENRIIDTQEALNFIEFQEN